MQKSFAACRESPDQTDLVTPPVIRASELFIKLWSSCFLYRTSLCCQRKLLAHSGRVVLGIGGTRPTWDHGFMISWVFSFRPHLLLWVWTASHWRSFLDLLFTWRNMATSAQHLNVAWAADHPLPSHYRCIRTQHRQEPLLLHPLLLIVQPEFGVPQFAECLNPEWNDVVAPRHTEPPKRPW